LTGTTGTTVYAVEQTLPGYSVDSAYTGTKASGVVAADGSLVLSLYYTAGDKTAYTVKHYKVTNGTPDLADTDELKGTTNTTATAEAKNYTGYTVDKSYEGTVASGTIAGDGSLVLILYYTPKSDVSYKVNYLLQSDDSVLAPQSTVSGKTFDTTVIVESAKITGYTVVAPASKELTLDAYGKEVTFYYTPSTDTDYQVEHWIVDANPNGEGPETDLYFTDELKGTTNTTATAEEMTINGYTLDTEYDGTILTANIDADGQAKMRLFYPANTDVPYQVNYLEQGTDKVIAVTKIVTGQTFNTTVSEPAIAITGYTLVSASTQKLLLNTFPYADNQNQITFYYTQNDLNSTKVYQGTKADLDALKEGEKAPWLITITNGDKAEAKDVKVVENNTTAVFGTVKLNGVALTEGVYYTVNEATRTLIIKSIPASGVITIAVTTTVTDEEAAAGVVGNTVTVDGEEIVGVVPKLVSTKEYQGTGAELEALGAGDEAQWLITITNNGAGVSRNKEVIEQNPTAVYGKVYRNGTEISTGFTKDGLKLTIDEIAPGDVITIDVTTTVTDEEAASVIGNTVTVDGETIIGKVPHLVSTKEYQGTSEELEALEENDKAQWLITIINTGDGAAKNKEVVEQNLTAVYGSIYRNGAEISTGFTKAGLKLTINEIAPGDVITIDVTTTVTEEEAASIIGNTVTVDGDIIIGKVAHLVSTKVYAGTTAQLNALKADELAPWLITITNEGNAAAKNKEVVEQNLTAVYGKVYRNGAEISTGFTKAGLKLTIAEIAPGDVITIDVTTTVSETEVTAGVVGNTVTVDGEIIIGKVPHLVSGKEYVGTVEVKSLKADELAPWLITITNDGNGIAKNKEVVEKNLTAVYGSVYRNGAEISTGFTKDGLKLTIDEIAPGDVITIDVTTTVTEEEATSIIGNEVTVDGEEIIGVVPNLNSTKTYTGPTTGLTVGQRVEWTVVITNNGTGAAKNVLVEERGNAVYDEDGKTILTPATNDPLITKINGVPRDSETSATYIVPIIEQGKSITLTVTTAVTEAELDVQRLGNAVEVNGDVIIGGDSDLGDLDSEKVYTGPTTNVEAGDDAAWLITITNHGDGTVNNVLVEENNTTAVFGLVKNGGITLENGTDYTVNAAARTLTIAKIAKGDVITIVVTTKVTAEELAAGVLENSAEVDGVHVPGDGSELADLSTVKEYTGPVNELVDGQDVSWLITITNSGKGDATGVVVKELKEATLLSVKGSDYTGDAFPITLDKVPAGGEVKVVLTTKVTQAEIDAKKIENSVEVDGVTTPGTDNEWWTVSWDTDGGLPAAIASKNVVKGQAIGTWPANPYGSDPTAEPPETSDRAAYWFDAWEADNTDGTGAHDETYVPAKNTTFKALWTTEPLVTTEMKHFYYNYNNEEVIADRQTTPPPTISARHYAWAELAGAPYALHTGATEKYYPTVWQIEITATPLPELDPLEALKEKTDEAEAVAEEDNIEESAGSESAESGSEAVAEAEAAVVVEAPADTEVVSQEAPVQLLGSNLFSGFFNQFFSGFFGGFFKSLMAPLNALADEAADVPAVQEEVAAPEVAAPEVADPEVAAPEVTDPEVAAPEVTDPEAADTEGTDEVADETEEAEAVVTEEDEELVLEPLEASFDTLTPASDPYEFKDGYQYEFAYYYTEPAPEYVTVTFVDGYHTGAAAVVSAQTIIKGESATAPGTPSRSNYNFLFWSGSYTNVQANVTVTATWEWAGGGGGGGGGDTIIINQPPVIPPAPVVVQQVPEEVVAPVMPTGIEDFTSPRAVRTAGWALLNLIMTIITALIMVMLLVAYFNKRKEEEEIAKLNNEKPGKMQLGIRLFSIAATAIAVVLFALTEDLTQSMLFADQWTMWHAFISIASIVIALLAKKKDDADASSLGSVNV
jgi:3-hydroxymyristoyl/3-hydroxydecanoyl-(acyl carrier protein) dehydratase